MSLRKQRGNMDQRKKEPPVCANSADTGGFYTKLANIFSKSVKKAGIFLHSFTPLSLSKGYEEL